MVDEAVMVGVPRLDRRLMVKVAMEVFVTVMVMVLEGKRKRGAFWDEITEIMFWKGGAAKRSRPFAGHTSAVPPPPRKGKANNLMRGHPLRGL